MKYLLLGLLLAWQSALAEPDPFPQVASAYLVQVNGATLWERQSGRRLPPASLTKLMTALLAVENVTPNDIVTISRNAARTTGSRLALPAGSRFSVQDLLKASLIHSANDACLALAEHVSGSEEEFVALMNARAKRMGLRDTHFQNACGHDAPDHYSSAHDLAALARHALDIPAIRDAAGLAKAEIRPIDSNATYLLRNKNALIGRYDGALGLKTGYTPQAGKCLVAYAVRGQKRVLLVMLHAHDRWWDAADILDIAFSHAS